MQVQMRDIQVGDNYRVETSEYDVAGLMASIKEDGLLQPIVVSKKGSKYEVVAGHRRYNAVKKLGLKTIEVNVVNIKNDVHRTIINVVENLQRENATSNEIGRAFKKMQEQGEMSDSEIGVKVGLPKSAVTMYLKIYSRTPAKFRHLVRSVRKGVGGKKGQISNTIASSIIELQKRGVLNRKQTHDLFSMAAKDDDMTVGKVAVLGRSLSDGSTFEAAKESLRQDFLMTHSFIISKKDKLKLEKKHKKSIRRLIVESFTKQYRINIKVQ